MYTIFISDDEFAIREGLKSLVDWEALGFKICGEASNGSDSLANILAKRPDISILDIRMPKLHGIDVIKEAREQGYTGKFILLSGYSDFRYAQNAIRYGVDYYLTKPIDEDELSLAISELKTQLDQEYKKDNYISLCKRKAKYVILQELLTNTYESDSFILSATDRIDLNLEADIYQVVLYENFDKTISDLAYNFADLLKIANKGNQSFECISDENTNIILLKGNYALKKFQDFLNHYEKLTPQKGSPLDSLFLAYGKPVTNLTDIHQSYEDALALIHRRFFCSPGQHRLGYEELPTFYIEKKEITDDLLQNYANLLTDHIQTFNRNKVSETLNQLKEYLFKVDDEIPAIKLFLTDMYLQIKEKINHLYSTIDIPFPTNSTIIECIDSKYYLYEIIEFLSEQFEMIMRSTGNSSRDSIIDDVIYYIDHNYKNNIKLETIAPLFGYNSAYLGKIFSKTVGISFNSYVDTVRINQSKKLLLQNDLKVYKISELIGYKNVDYFHKKFKKYVGISPAEYRKRNEARQSQEESASTNENRS